MKKTLIPTKWGRTLLTAVIIGTLTSLATGLIPHPGPTIPGIQNYGHPWTWRITNLYGPSTYLLPNLALNTLFWTTLTLPLYPLLHTVLTTREITVNHKKLALFLILFLPLGLVMDLIHEGGHAFWGILAGGHLTYLQIAYFQLYPTPALTSHFRLGYVQIQGLPTAFSQGLMGLGGSLTTHLAAWLIGFLLLKTKPKAKIKTALHTLGLFGILDLPFYTFLPQLGLPHWIIIGGRTAEPLLAAQKLGIPPPPFYLIVVLATLALTSLYHPAFFKKLLKTSQEKICPPREDKNRSGEI